MKTFKMKWIGAAMLALTLGACDAAQEFTSPGGDETSMEAQRFAEFERSVLDAARAAGINTQPAGAELSFSLTGDDSGEWVAVEGQVGDHSVEAVIGAAGGELRLGRHWLLVPAGTVLSRTRFVMTPIQDGTMHVDLTATSALGNVEENDVGSAGFSQPVYLSFSVDAASFDPMSAAIAWVHEEGMQVQPSFVYQDDSVVGALTHFSGYVLVAN